MPANAAKKRDGDIPFLDLDDGVSDFFATRQQIRDHVDGDGMDIHTAIRRFDRIAGDIQPEFGPKQSLLSIVAKLWLDERSGSRSDSDVVYALQKKIALHGRLAKYFDRHLRKIGEIYADHEELSLFAGLLIIRHLRNGSMNELNSAIKIIDGIVASEQMASKMVQSALLLEGRALRGMFDG